VFWIVCGAVCTHGERTVFAIGGVDWTKNFLSALELPADMRALLYQNRGDHFSADLRWIITAGSLLPRPDRRQIHASD